MLLQPGTPAPAFCLVSDTGASIDLTSLLGKMAVLYFYPKDDTSGCTKQALAFNSLSSQFEASGAHILGVSPDSVASHKKFKDKYGLRFPLLSDESKTSLQAYGVWTEKSMYGRAYMGVERTTFLIDAQGLVARIWPKVKVPGHAEEVLKAIQSINH